MPNSRRYSESKEIEHGTLKIEDLKKGHRTYSFDAFSINGQIVNRPIVNYLTTSLSKKSRKKGQLGPAS